MKITLDEATLSKAVINHLRDVGVTSDILQVVFRYTRVPYTVFAEVELAEAPRDKMQSTKVRVSKPEVEATKSIVDPDNLPPLEETSEEAPKPETPAAPLFGGG